MFNYYYGREAEQFTFIRIPKLLLTDERFKELSISAKFIYGVLLDRMSLSRKNGWLDEDGRVYIIYQISEIQEDFGFSKGKVIELLKELERIGLLEKKRRGMGLPSILYVKSFCDGAPDDFPTKKTACDTDEEDLKNNLKDFMPRAAIVSASVVESPTENASAQCVQEKPKRTPLTNKKGYDETFLNSLSGELQVLLSEDENAKKQEVQKLNFKKFGAENSESEVQNLNSRSSKIEPQKFKNWTSRSLKNEPPICSNTYKSKTECNNTYYNNTYPSTSCRFNFSDMTEDKERCAYSEIIKENIGLDALMEQRPEQRELISDIYNVIVDTMMTKDITMQVARKTWSADSVKTRLMKLTSEHIEHVLGCMKRANGPIRDRRKYLLTALFNSIPEVGGLSGNTYQNSSNTKRQKGRSSFNDFDQHEYSNMEHRKLEQAMRA